MLTLGPRGVLLVIGGTRSDECRFLEEGSPLITEPGALSKSGNAK